MVYRGETPHQVFMALGTHFQNNLMTKYLIQFSDYIIQIFVVSYFHSFIRILWLLNIVVTPDEEPQNSCTVTVPHTTHSMKVYYLTWVFPITKHCETAVSFLCSFFIILTGLGIFKAGLHLVLWEKLFWLIIYEFWSLCPVIGESWLKSSSTHRESHLEIWRRKTCRK